MDLLKDIKGNDSSKRVGGVFCLLMGAILSFMGSDIVHIWVTAGVGLLAAGVAEHFAARPRRQNPQPPEIHQKE